MSPRRLVHLSLYAVPSFFSKGVSLVLLPVYVAHLSVAQFGQLELLVTVLVLIQQGLHLGWSRAFLRFHAEEGVDARDFVVSLLALRAAVQAAVVAAVALSEGERVAAWLTTEASLAPALVQLAALFCLRDLIQLFDLQFRVREQAARFAAMHVSYALLQLAFVYVLLAQRGQGVVGVLVGQTAASLVVLAILVIFQGGWLREALAHGRVDAALCRRMLRFGLPLAPAAILTWVMTTSDRYMLRWLLDGSAGALDAVGVYAFAGKAAQLVTMLLNGLGAFFLPWAFRIYREPRGPERLAHALGLYAAGMLGVALLLFVGLPPAVGRFFPAYQGSLAVAFLLIAGIVAHRVAADFSIGIDVAERNVSRLAATAAATASNVGANLLLIPRFGIEGAGVASLLAGLVYALLVMPPSQRHLPVPHRWSVWAFAVAWIAAAAAVEGIAPGWRPVHAALGLVVFVALFVRAGWHRPPAAG